MPGPRLRGLRSDKWLFDPSSKTWYTPAEFKDRFEHIISGNEKFLAQIQVRDPMEGINAGNLRVQNMQIKLENMILKVIAYYRKKR